MTFKPIICIDFDGVLHSYSSGWQGPDVANDPPVKGAIEWLRGLIVGGQCDPQIYSSRSRQDGGIICMKNWLIKHGLEIEHADALQFPTQKPAAFLTIDDRAFCFKGEFPETDDILNFQPWNSKWPKWKRYADDEAAKWGMKVKIMDPDERKREDRVKLYSDDGYEEEVRILMTDRRIHYSIVEPKVRGQIRLAALKAQRARDIKAKRTPRAICGLHKFTHMPNEPPCEWEIGQLLPSWFWIAKDEASKHGLGVQREDTRPAGTYGHPESEGHLYSVSLVSQDWTMRRLGISEAAERMQGDALADHVRQHVQLKAAEILRDMAAREAKKGA